MTKIVSGNNFNVMTNKAGPDADAKLANTKMELGGHNNAGEAITTVHSLTATKDNVRVVKSTSGPFGSKHGKGNLNSL